MRRAAGYASKFWWAMAREKWPTSERTEHWERAAIRAGRIAQGRAVIRKLVPGLCNSKPPSSNNVIIEMCDLPAKHMGTCMTREGHHLWWP